MDGFPIAPRTTRGDLDDIEASLKTFGASGVRMHREFDTFYALGMACLKTFEERLPATARACAVPIANGLRDAREAARRSSWGQVHGLQRSIVFAMALMTDPDPVIEFPSGNEACDIFYALGAAAVDAFEVFVPKTHAVEMALSDLRITLLDARQSACAAQWGKIRSLQRDMVITTVVLSNLST